VSSQRVSESFLLAAPIIEMIELFRGQARGQAFFPRLVLVVGAKMCKSVGEKVRADYKLMIMPISIRVFHSHQSRFEVYLYGAPCPVKIV
jgi:hypothetical protein